MSSSRHLARILPATAATMTVIAIVGRADPSVASRGEAIASSMQQPSNYAGEASV